MCEVLDRVEARGIAVGEARGIAMGEARGIAMGEARGITKGATEAIEAMQLISKGYTTIEELCEQGISKAIAEQVIQSV